MIVNKIDSEIPQKMFQHTKNSKKTKKKNPQLSAGFFKIFVNSLKA